MMKRKKPVESFERMDGVLKINRGDIIRVSVSISEMLENGDLERDKCGVDVMGKE